ncbi:MAG: epimerase, partial [Candidatus Competibacter sp.]|nr:epimerase [Candidatus Competibacter sp.]
GQTYFVTDGVAYSGGALYRMLRAALGRPIPRWTVPAGVLRGGAKAADGLLWLLGRGDRKARNALDKLLGWACYDATRIGDELGYRPVWTLERYCQELFDGHRLALSARKR